jgi:hypothetical protein
MTTVVELRAGQLRRNKPTSQRAVDEFRDDVLTYGSVVYEALKRRRDFCVSTPPEHKESRRTKYEESAD